MSNPTVAIVGIPVEPGQPLPLRQEISAWAKNEDNGYQVSLFLRALANFKAKNIEEKLGYFQIAGIHSYPLVPWDGDGQPTPEPNPPGFCNHNLVTFPTWHRPYMLLYEQTLYANMLELISGWPIDEQEKATWSAAASKFRLPYWDWAQKQDYTGDYGIPQLCTLPAVDIIKPGANGAKESFENPLTGFVNPMTDSLGQNVPMGDPSMGDNAIKDNVDTSTKPHTILPWSKCIGISRYWMRQDQPEPTWIHGGNNWQYSNEGIKSPQWYDGQQGPLKSSSFADAVSRLFTPEYFKSWETFASTAHNTPYDTTNTNFMSLEYIHNVVHNATGGSYFSSAQRGKDPVGFPGLGLGHMSDVPVAAFDPIFWLHHSNIDRLCAMWQALNWDMWFNDPQANDPASSAPLHPFHFDEQAHNWTSDRGRDWRLSNYQYDDLKDMPPGVPTPEFQASLRHHINRLYPSTSSAIRPLGGYTLEHDTFNDYVINVVYDRYALNGRAYSILFYIGDPSLAFSASKDDPNFVGAVYTFSAPFVSADGKTTCDNCGKQQAAKVLSKAQIPLTLPLIRRVSKIHAGYSSIPATPLGSLVPDRVEKVLDVGLKWYFIALGGREVEPSAFPNTEIAVLQGTGKHPVGDRIMPRYSDYTKLTDATKNKPLGYGHELGPNDLIKDD